MKVGFYAVLDLKSGAYMAPFTLHTDGMAIRAFGDTCGEPSSVFNRHPEDFVLYKLGDFDDKMGSVECCSPVPLCKASDFGPKGELNNA